MAKRDCLVVLPARMSSARLPGKPLLDVAGKPLLWHAWRNACAWDRAARVVVATDSEAIQSWMETFGANVVMTSPHCRNGTERCFEVWRNNDCEAHHLVNLQADEPCITPDMLDLLLDHKAMIGTLAGPLTERDRVNRHEVKVVVDRLGYALYFTRHPLPLALRHVGAYTFRGDAVRRIANKTARDSPLAAAENLEQLSWMEAGFAMWVGVLDASPLAVNTHEDLAELKRRMGNHGAVPVPGAPKKDDTLSSQDQRAY